MNESNWPIQRKLLSTCTRKQDSGTCCVHRTHLKTRGPEGPTRWREDKKCQVRTRRQKLWSHKEGHVSVLKTQLTTKRWVMSVYTKNNSQILLKAENIGARRCEPEDQWDRSYRTICVYSWKGRKWLLPWLTRTHMRLDNLLQNKISVRAIDSHKSSCLITMQWIYELTSNQT
jgi:hypothetical protein